MVRTWVDRGCLLEFLAVLGLLSGGCVADPTPTNHSSPFWSSSVPTPTVMPEGTGVEIGPKPPPISYGSAWDRQCDSFQQTQNQKVDILLMISSEGSMAARQQELQANLQAFVTYLLTESPPLDFHLGVITADADDPNESGHLHTWTEPSIPSSWNYIACDSQLICNVVGSPSGSCLQSGAACTDTADCCSGYECNFNGVCDPTDLVIDAATQLTSVGGNGSPTDRGLFTSFLALTDPANQDRGHGGFIRPDAALRLVMIADDDDLSCSPEVGIPTSESDVCTDDPGCRCDDHPAFGSSLHWAQFFATYKGEGAGNRVTVSAIVGANNGPVDSRLGGTNYYPGTTTWDHVGCGNPIQPYPAYWGQRYLEVAAMTGGVQESICEPSFAQELSSIANQITGLQQSFPLSHQPQATTVVAYEAPSPSDCAFRSCQVDQDCAQPDCHGNTNFASCEGRWCSQVIPVSEQASPVDAQVQLCTSDGGPNQVTFGGSVIPPANGLVEICYTPAPGGDGGECQ